MARISVYIPTIVDIMVTTWATVSLRVGIFFANFLTSNNSDFKNFLFDS